MSDEQRKDEETEVDGHITRAGANDDTAKDGDGGVEGHGAYPPKYGANDEPEDEVEGHMYRAG